MPPKRRVRKDPITSKREGTLAAMKEALRQYRDVSDEVKRNTINDASNFERLTFFNPHLLTAAIIMYNRGINENYINGNLGVLDDYIIYLPFKKDNLDGIRNDLLRYVLIVQDHYLNKRAEASELIRMQTEAAMTAAEEEYEYEYED